MNYKKTVLVISLLATCGFLFNFGLPAVKAMTNAEIQALIAQLQAQIAALQQQLNQQPTDVAWCYTFNNNLRIGETSQEVLSLQQALSKEGIYEITTAEDGYFGEVTASAVVEFQEKYASEILTPVGLRHGNGFVGKLTRAKLNNLYGCTPSCKILWQYDKDQPYCHQDLICGAYSGDTFATEEECEKSHQQDKSITITSPNGGEQWKVGETHNIVWESTNLNGVKGSIVLNKYGKGIKTLAENYDLSLDKYIWVIDNDVSLIGNDFEIAIYVSDLSTLDYAFLDKSDNYFSIVAANTITCSDSENGDNVYNKGTITIRTAAGGQWNYTDYCVGSTAVNDYNCLSNTSQYPDSNAVSAYLLSYHACPNGCQDGACKSASSFNVTFPSSGATLQQGSTYNLTWSGSYSGVTSYSVYLVGSNLGSAAARFLGIAYEPQKLFSWTVPSDIVAGSGYQIQFSGTGASGGNSSYFSISGPSTVTISSNPKADIGDNLTIVKGSQLAITGSPSNIPGTLNVDYTKAFFFDPIFNGACSNDDGGWTMTCTASQTGTSNFYIEAYKGGQTYRSNVIKVSVVDGIFN